jgi:4-amino-4-deoxy-L-arabinose transferase-like glycosyltransferase
MPKEPLAKSSIEFLLGTIIALFLVVFPLTWWLKLIITFIFHLIDSSPLTIKWKRIIKTAVSFSIIFLLFATQSILIPEAKEIIMNIHKQFEGKPTWLVYGILCVIGSFLMCGYWGLPERYLANPCIIKMQRQMNKQPPSLISSCMLNRELNNIPYGIIR